MPSRPSAWRADARRSSSRAAAILALTASLAACSGGPDLVVAPPPPAGPAVRAEDRPFLLDPLASYPLVAEPSAAEQVRQAHRELLADGAAPGLSALASTLLERDPGFHPAHVLAAQVELIQGKCPAALDRLASILAELPGYLAARLVLGRCAELGDEVVLAYATYRDAALVAAVGERLLALEPRALEIVGKRVDDALARARLEDATSLVEQLEAWAPAAIATLGARRRLAAAQGDREGELQAVRSLTVQLPKDLALAERRAALEIEVGDASAGVQVLRRLVAEHPGESRLAAELERAEFRWRVTMLPAAVRSRTSLGQLRRDDFAVLLYWLLPSVRHTRVQSGRIAADVLDHPDRDAIVRVVNLGLMEVDPVLHRFVPEASVQRIDALGGLLRFLQGLPKSVACVRQSPLAGRPAGETVCRRAEACGLIDEAADCLPRAPVAGSEALELVRRTLRLVDGP